jgi:outer membrane lipoprotein-sorting protein
MKLNVFCCLTGALMLPLIGLSAEPDEGSYVYERESHTEVTGQNVSTVVDETTKVWIKDGMVRVEGPTPPRGQRQVVIYRDHNKFLLNMEQKTAVKISTSGQKSDAIQPAPVRLEAYEAILLRHGARLLPREPVQGEDCNVYAVPPTRGGEATASEIHKVWISTRTHRPIKETVQTIGATTTVSYKNVEIGESLPDELFQVPNDFKVVDVSREGDGASLRSKPQ